MEPPTTQHTPAPQYLIYVWARRNPEQRVTLYTFPMEALYLPFALACFQMLIGNSIFPCLLGIGVGHVYYFVLEVAPAQAGWPDIIRTPKFLCQWFGAPPPMMGAQGGRGPAQAAQPGRAPQRGYQWGQGRTLGT